MKVGKKGIQCVFFLENQTLFHSLWEMFFFFKIINTGNIWQEFGQHKTSCCTCILILAIVDEEQVLWKGGWFCCYYVFMTGFPSCYYSFPPDGDLITQFIEKICLHDHLLFLCVENSDFFLRLFAILLKGEITRNIYK